MTLENPSGRRPSSGPKKWRTRLEAIQDGLSDGVITIDEAGVIREVNPAAEQIFGHDAVDLIGRNVSILVPDPQGAAHDAYIQRYLSTGETKIIGSGRQLEGRRRDGTLFPMLLRISDVMEGDTRFFVAIVRDLTSQVEAGKQIRLQAAALESAANAIVITDLGGRIEWVNPAFTRLTGYDLSEVRGKNPRVLKSGHHPTEFFHNLWETVLAGEVWRGETVNRKKDGSLYVEEQTITPVTDPAGRLTHFVAIKNDITVRRKAEEALQRSEEQYRLVVENVREIIFRCDTEGRWAFLNPAWTELLGYPVGESVGRSFQQYVDPADHDLAARMFLSLRDGIMDVARKELRGITRAGVTRWFEVVAVRLEGPDGVFAGTSGTITDITRRKEVERLKSDFVSTVSHELRTPLTSIKGSLGLLAGGVGGVLSPQAADLLDIAQRNCERLGLLINDLLDMEKLDSGKMAFSIRVEELVPLVELAMDGASAYAGQFGVVFWLNESVPGARVKVDPDRLNQVLVNLLSNAAKYSPKNSTVEVSVTRVSGRLRVAVRDYGPGIPEEFRPRLFEKFAQADGSDTRQKGGTGLGLSISKNIIQRLGGTLDFQSEMGEGTTFFFELPELEVERGSETPAPDPAG